MDHQRLAGVLATTGLMKDFNADRDRHSLSMEYVRKSTFTLHQADLTCDSWPHGFGYFSYGVIVIENDHISSFLHTGSRQSPLERSLQRATVFFRRCWLLLFRLLSAISLLCGQGRLMNVSLDPSASGVAKFSWAAFLVLFQ